MATATKDPVVKDAQNASVRVEIFDQAYNLRGSDPDYILKLAEYVDAKMRAVAEATNTIDTVRLAVLAALNIADEYHLLKKKQDGRTTDYQKRAHLLAQCARRSFAGRPQGRLVCATPNFFSPFSRCLPPLSLRKPPSARARIWSSFPRW